MRAAHRNNREAKSCGYSTLKCDSARCILHLGRVRCIYVKIYYLASGPLMYAPLEFHGVPMTCIARASSTYGVPVQDIIALMKNEGGRPGTASRDSNRTVDLGPMQVNTCHLPFLSAYGYHYSVLRYNGCANVMAGSWVFARCLARTGNLLAAAACYNAGVGNQQAAWRTGYVQRFAEHLGLVIGDRGNNKALGNQDVDASLVVER